MEGWTMSGDVWNAFNSTTSLLEDDDPAQYLANIRQLPLKIIYIIIGTVGVLDNLFVIIVFVLCIKITDKVLTLLNCFLYYSRHIKYKHHCR